MAAHVDIPSSESPLAFVRDVDVSAKYVKNTTQSRNLAIGCLRLNWSWRNAVQSHMLKRTSGLFHCGENLNFGSYAFR
ncbi:MAG: hypothetical protein ABSA12_02750 [Verrucomicrobiia bacterium]|jgi:hypothetical protein